MGTFSVSVGIGHPNGNNLLEVYALVDTGATHSMIPKSMLDELGIKPYGERPVGFANGQRERRSIGKMRVVYDREEWECPVFFGPEGRYLMGATTLELFGLMVDPNGQRLIPFECVS